MERGGSFLFSGTRDPFPHKTLTSFHSEQDSTPIRNRRARRREKGADILVQIRECLRTCPITNMGPPNTNASNL